MELMFVPYGQPALDLVERYVGYSPFAGLAGIMANGLADSDALMDSPMVDSPT